MNDDEKDCRCPQADHVHGTWHAYATDDCRCHPCKHAWMLYCRQLRKRRYLSGGSMFTNGVGVARRLQALSHAGWGSPQLGQLLGCRKFVVEEWRRGVPKVHVRTHARIAALYDELWDQPPAGRYAVKVRNSAIRNRYQPALAWDDDTIDDPDARPLAVSVQRADVDEIAVERALGGERLPLTKAERAEVARRFTEAGVSSRDIADRLNTTTRTVTRHRAADRKEAAA